MTIDDKKINVDDIATENLWDKENSKIINFKKVGG